MDNNYNQAYELTNTSHNPCVVVSSNTSMTSVDLVNQDLTVDVSSLNRGIPVYENKNNANYNFGQAPAVHPMGQAQPPLQQQHPQPQHRQQPQFVSQAQQLSHHQSQSQIQQQPSMTKLPSIDTFTLNENTPECAFENSLSIDDGFTNLIDPGFNVDPNDPPASIHLNQQINIPTAPLNPLQPAQTMEPLSSLQPASNNFGLMETNPTGLESSLDSDPNFFKNVDIDISVDSPKDIENYLVSHFDEAPDYISLLDTVPVYHNAYSHGLQNGNNNANALQTSQDNLANLGLMNNLQPENSVGQVPNVPNMANLTDSFPSNISMPPVQPVGSIDPLNPQAPQNLGQLDPNLSTQNLNLPGSNLPFYEQNNLNTLMTNPATPLQQVQDHNGLLMNHPNFAHNNNNNNGGMYSGLDHSSNTGMLGFDQFQQPGAFGQLNHESKKGAAKKPSKKTNLNRPVRRGLWEVISIFFQQKSYGE